MSRITRIGNSVGVTLSRDTLAAANLALGDEVTVTPVQDGVFIAAAASVQGRMLAAALADMDRRPDLYRKLAE
jgi:putative addiction module antidote